jgi:NAD-dependent SIR2 family protein deacetylase
MNKVLEAPESYLKKLIYTKSEDRKCIHCRGHIDLNYVFNDDNDDVYVSFKCDKCLYKQLIPYDEEWKKTTEYTMDAFHEELNKMDF